MTNTMKIMKQSNDIEREWEKEKTLHRMAQEAFLRK